MRFKIASYFLGMVIRGELRISGSSSKTACDDTVGIWSSSDGFVSDWQSANSALDWVTAMSLSTSLVEARFTDSPIL